MLIGYDRFTSFSWLVLNDQSQATRTREERGLWGVWNREISRTMAYTTRSTVNRLACEELHIWILWYQNDQRRNKPIQRAPEAQSESCKKQNFFKQAYSFFEVKLRLRRKTGQSKYDTRDKNLPTRTVLANSSNHSRARPHNIEICKQATRSQ